VSAISYADFCAVKFVNSETLVYSQDNYTISFNSRHRHVHSFIAPFCLPYETHSRSFHCLD